jgi:hypothetical protein
MKTIKDKSENLATPGKPMSQKKFAAMIKEAEEGEFMTLEDSKKHFETWRKKISK